MAANRPGTDSPWRGYVLSDLHLFTERTLARDWEPALDQAAADADLVVFNGDIFDFRWTPSPTPGASVADALRWVGVRVAAHPDCRFVYVLGNHDALLPFAEGLSAMAIRHPNLTWVPSHVRIGSSLFLHGDLPLRWLRAGLPRRQLPPSVRPWGGAAGWLYGVAVGLGLHGSGRWAYPRRRSARRILRSIEDADGGIAPGLTDVYFGHTHAPFTRYRYRGLTFHNTGSAIRGLSGGMLPLRIHGGPEAS